MDQTFVLMFEGREIIVGGMTPEQQLDLETEIVGLQYQEYSDGRPEYSISFCQY